jgi:hypothetical protein
MQAHAVWSDGTTWPKRLGVEGAAAAVAAHVATHTESTAFVGNGGPEASAGHDSRPNLPGWLARRPSEHGANAGQPCTTGLELEVIGPAGEILCLGRRRV